MAYVTTGFSKPYYALYAASGGSVTYSNGTNLARGVSVAVDATVVEDNNFYADNILAESENGQVSGGTLTLTVDGLSPAARRAIYGLPAASTTGTYNGYTGYGDEAAMPFVGVGFIRRTMNNGTTNYWAVVFPKVKFAFDGEDAQTSEDQISWQTKELSASFFKDDTANHNWKYVNDTAFTSEALAEAAIKTFLSIT
jgi:phi13 family phage major tail protein